MPHSAYIVWVVWIGAAVSFECMPGKSEDLKREDIDEVQKKLNIRLNIRVTILGITLAFES